MFLTPNGSILDTSDPPKGYSRISTADPGTPLADAESPGPSGLGTKRRSALICRCVDLSILYETEWYFRRSSKAHQKQPYTSTADSTANDEDLPITEECLICFNPHLSSGTHQVSSLQCGHVFGRSCIEQWLGTMGTCGSCPTCKKPARVNDVVPLFIAGVKVG